MHTKPLHSAFAVAAYYDYAIAHMFLQDSSIPLKRMLSLWA